jgi:hypothetical protein
MPALNSSAWTFPMRATTEKGAVLANPFRNADAIQHGEGGRETRGLQGLKIFD